MNVPWAVGGPRIEADGSLRNFPGDWPNMPIAGLRLWDTRTAWLNIEPADDAWQFTHLDALVVKAEEQQVEVVTMVLAGTPRWAATGRTAEEAPWLGPGSASPPRELRQWRQFVRMVASRYAGRIDAYQVWNEPNSKTFFSGTPQQWAALVRVAAEEIAAADPNAKVVASGIALNTTADLVRARPWLQALAVSGARVDALAVHWYPRTWRQVRDLGSLAQRLRSQAKIYGLPANLWITEANAKFRPQLPREIQSRMVRAIIEQSQQAGAASLIWYAWLDLPSNLMPIYRGTVAAKTLAGVSRCST